MPFAERYSFFRMNTDDDDSVIRDGGYRLLRNGRIGNTSGEFSGTIENIRGNLKISDNNQFPTTGTNKVIGGRYIDSDGSYIFMLYNSNAQHGIYRLLDGVIEKIFEWSGLNFTEDLYIDQIDIIRGEIYWTDDLNEPRTININKALSDNYPDIITEKDITQIRRPPIYPLQVSRELNTEVETNNVYDQAYRFAYRYMYDNNKFSVFSTYSDFINLTQDEELNYISLTIPNEETVPHDVQRIELYVERNATGIFYLIKELDPNEISYDFYDNNTGISIDGQLSSQAYDDVPLLAKGQSFLDNRILFANYVKGFALPSSINLEVTVITPPSSSTIDGTIYRIDEDDGGGNITVVGYYAYVSLYVRASDGTPVFSYYPVEYDDVNDVYIVNDNRRNALTETRLLAATSPASRTKNEISGTIVRTSTTTTNQPVFKKNGRYKLGILFKDFAGRHSGVVTSDENEFSIEEDVADNLGNWATWNLSSTNPLDAIPEWADHYHIVITSEYRYSFFIKNTTTDVWYHSFVSRLSTEVERGFSKTNTTAYMLFDVSGLTSNNIAYTYEEGDKMHVWIPDLNTGNLKKRLFDIISYDGKFIKCSCEEGSRGILPDTLENNLHWTFEIFRPKQQDIDQRYYETGQVYPINNPGTPLRDFSTKTNTLYGDVYHTFQGVLFYDDSVYNTTDPEANTILRREYSEVLESMSPAPEFSNQWFNVRGKVSIESDFDGEFRSTTGIMFGQQIFPNSKINNLNRFFTLDRYDLIRSDSSPIIKLTAISESLLLANHERSTTTLYVGTGFIQTKDGTEFLAKTEGVITDHRTMLGDFGAIKETIFAEGHRAWWLDIEKGLVIRYTQGGTEPISNKQYKFNSYIKDLSDKYKPYYKTNKIVGGYDPDFEEYYITFPEIAGLYEAQTIFFSETTQNWVGVVDFKDSSGKVPEMIGRTPKKMISFINGELWEHGTNPLYNNFYGIQYDRKLTMVANVAPSKNKVWNNIWAHVDEISGTNDYEAMVIENHLGQKTIIYRDEMNLNEGAWKGTVWFDMNTPGLSTEVARRDGERIRSKYIDITINTSSSTPNPLKQVTVLFKISEFSI